MLKSNLSIQPINIGSLQKQLTESNQNVLENHKHVSLKVSSAKIEEL